MRDIGETDLVVRAFCTSGELGVGGMDWDRPLAFDTSLDLLVVVEVVGTRVTLSGGGDEREGGERVGETLGGTEGELERGDSLLGGTGESLGDLLLVSGSSSSMMALRLSLLDSVLGTQDMDLILTPPSMGSCPPPVEHECCLRRVTRSGEAEPPDSSLFLCFRRSSFLSFSTVSGARETRSLAAIILWAELGLLTVRISSSVVEEEEEMVRWVGLSLLLLGGRVCNEWEGRSNTSSCLSVLVLSAELMELADPAKGPFRSPSGQSVHVMSLVSFSAFCISVQSFDTFSVSCFCKSSCCWAAPSSSRPLGRGAKDEEALELGEGSRDEALSRHRAESNELVELLRPSEGWVWVEREVVLSLIHGCSRHLAAVRRSLDNTKLKLQNL